MSKFKSKLARRIVAIALAGAMVMSSMTSSGIATYAAESATEKTSEVETVQEVKNDDDNGEAEETPEKAENNLIEGEGEPGGGESKPTSGGESEPGGGESKPTSGGESEPASKPADGGESEPESSKAPESSKTPESSSDEGSSSEESSSDEGSSSEESSSGEESSSEENSSAPDDEKPETRKYVMDISTDMPEEYLNVTQNTNITPAGTVLRMGPNDFFTVYTKKTGNGSRIDVDAKTFPDGYTTKQSLNIQGSANVAAKDMVIEFTTAARADIKIWWRGGGSGARTMALYAEDGSQLGKGTAAGEAGDLHIDSFSVEEGGTYYIGCDGGANRVFKIEVEAEIKLETYKMDVSTDMPEEYLNVTQNTNITPAGTVLRMGKNDFFTVYTKKTGNGSRIDVDAKTFPDGYTTKQSLNIQGSANVAAKDMVIEFTTAAKADIKIWWRGGGSGARTMALYAEDGSQLGKGTAAGEAGDLHIDSFSVEEGGTYYIGCDGGANRVFKIEVKTEEVSDNTQTRVEWPGDIAVPEITNVALDDTNKGKINVSVNALVNYYTGGDTLTVTMSYKNEDGTETVADTKQITEEQEQHLIEFTPSSSNTYYFSAVLERNGEEIKLNSKNEDAEGNDIRKKIEFTLPLSDVTIGSITNKGKADDKYGIIEAVWSAVDEVTCYEVAIYEGDANPESLGEKTPIYQKDETKTLLLIGKKDASDANSGWLGSVEGLEIGKEYTVFVTAKRAKPAVEGAEPEFEKSKTAFQKITINGKDMITWNWANFGDRANLQKIKTQKVIETSLKETDADFEGVPYMGGDPEKDTGKFGKIGAPLVTYEMRRNGYAEVLDEDENLKKVRVWSLDSYGKIVPKEVDGVSVYYTSVNPSSYNFKLGADLHVDQWSISNGQEGFGLVAFDQVGQTPPLSTSDSYEGGSVWNNSYMAAVTKTEYKWDEEQQKVANAGNAVSLKLGIGSIVRTGVTKDNVNDFKVNKAEAMAKSGFKSVQKPLDTQVHDKTYDNLIGNYTESGPVSIANPITDLRLEIELNDTGYFVSYIPIENGKANYDKKVTNKGYDRTALSKIDENNVYLGFFAARHAMVTFSNIEFTTTPYDEATANPEPMEVEVIAPRYAIASAAASNSEDYIFTYEANWNGTLVVKDENGDTIFRDENGNPLQSVKINGSPDLVGKATQEVMLNLGTNTFRATFTPDREYDPNAGDDTLPPAQLSNYDSVTELITVTYKKYGQEGQALYVAPLGKASGDGTKKNPLDIYTAVKYAQPGQTIYLMDGTYNLSKTVRIERGTDGTADKRIRMVPEPGSKSRPVFDFHGACAGMVIAGDYWDFYGFDVTRSEDRKDGINVCGDYNTLDSINTYKNGNTGIQISRLNASDINIDTDWPKYNTVKNCTSYLNADTGYEDADGFACKLTSGVGNKFIGCVAAFNADDGWDFFAKADSGQIGMVTIENCITYKNGYVLRADNGKGELAWYGEADNVVEVVAGNGNGFKMGGNSISGYHTLKNSLAFYNRAKGFDSNSCQDIQIYDSVTFNNEGYNVAFYTKATSMDFQAEGLVSYRTKFKDREDRIGERDSSTKKSNILTMQKDLTKVFNGKNYFWNTYTNVSELDTDFKAHYSEYYYSATSSTDNVLPEINEANTVKDNWFTSIDFDGPNGWFTKLIKESEETGVPHVVDRNANGTINMNGFLELNKNNIPSNIGGIGLPDLSDSEDDSVISKNPDIGAEETDGTIDKGNAEDEIGSGIDSDDLNKKPGTAKDQVGLWFSIVNEDEIGYTGKALKPEIRVYYDDILLTKKDYTVTYKNNINAWLGNTATGVPAANSGYESNVKKIPTIIVRGKRNYIGQAKEIYFEIQPVDFARETDRTKTDHQNRINAPTVTTANGKAAKPVVTFVARKLSDKKDYSYEEKTKEGGAKYLEITGKGNFTGTIAVDIVDISSVDKDHIASSFKIDKIDPADCYRRGYTAKYTGEIEEYLQVKPIKAGMVKSKNGTALTEYDAEKNPKGEYTISYVNNIEIGTASAIITGVPANGYYGTKEVKFRITAPPMAKLFKEGSLQWIDTGKLVRTGENKNYDANTEEITKIDSVGFTSAETYQYEGKAIVFDKLGVAAKRTVKDAEGKDVEKWYRLTKDTDYTLTYIGNNKAGSASVIAKGKGNYTGSNALRFKIAPFNIGDMSNTEKIGGTFTQKKVQTPGTPEGPETGESESEKPETKPSETPGTNASGSAEAALAEQSSSEASLTEGSNTDESSTDSSGSETPGTNVSGSSVYFAGSPAAGKGRNTIDYGKLKASVYFDKAGAKPTIALRINGNLMRAGKDYTITYKNNRKVGEDAVFTIRGIGGLTGTITGTYSVTKRPFNDQENALVATATDVKLSSKDGNGFKGKNNPRIVVKDANGRALINKKDYTISDTFEVVDNVTLQPKAHGETIVNTNGRPADINISGETDYKTVRVTITGAGDCYENQTIYAYYRITWAKNSIKTAKVTIDYGAGGKDNPGNAQKKYFYYKEGGVVTLNGDTLKIALNGNNLEFGKDYEVVSGSYSKNDKKGTAKLIIQGKGQYVETKVITFRIGAYDFVWWGDGGSSDEEEKPGTDVSSEEESSAVTESSKTEESSAATESSKTEESSAVTESSKTEESSAVTESSKTEESSAVTESSKTEESSAATESSKAEESSSAESSTTEESSSTESSTTEESGSTESSTTEESGSTESSTTEESGSTESSTTEESGSTESSTTEESGSTESSTTEESDSTESSATEESSATDGNQTNTYAAPRTSITQWFKNLFSSWFN